METIPSYQLRQWAENAAATSLQAGGHSKAERNKIKFEEYKKQLEARGFDVDFYKYGEKGQFNGRGSV